MLHVDLLTALPGLVESPLQHSILRRAQDKGKVQVVIHDVRDYSENKHRQIDDAPYGGQGGMVLAPGPLFRAVEALTEAGGPYDDVIYLTPDGETLTQPLANRLSTASRLLMIAGHYKGIDQRVRDALVTREISIGDYVLSGGELPALVLIDALARLIPGVLGDAQSALSDSFQDGLLDAPAYTRPADFRGMRVPDVLLSGDHAAVLDWRERERLAKTADRRPDLLPADDAPLPSGEVPRALRGAEGVSGEESR